jgi:hypothetical protein
MWAMWAMLAGVFICVLHARETCSTEGKKVSKRESKLWITFLLLKSYVGNVGNVGTPVKVAPTFVHTRHIPILLADI